MLSIPKKTGLNLLALTRNGLFIEKSLIHISSTKLVSKEFENAKSKLGTLKNDPGNDVKLKLYALFKQATVGPCNTPKPGMMDFVNRAKWTAWSELKLSQTDAENEYIKLVNELSKSEQPEVSLSTSSTSTAKYQDIETSVEFGNVYKIVLNRPAKLNAITFKMYKELIEALKEADADPKITMCCITGAGDYFCSGNDLTNFQTKEAMTNLKKAAKDGGILLEEFVNAFIDFSKPLAAVINGPAVGISVTILGLFDLVLASDKSTFYAPFTKIAQSPEACSTLTFPAMMGPVRASEFLLFNRKLSASEALQRNLITELIAHDKLQETAWKRIEEYSKLPKESLIASKRIVRGAQKEALKKANKNEVDTLVDRWSSSEFVQVMMDFWKNKSKK